MIEFGVLGPLTVHRDNQPIRLNAAKLRALLALLLHRPGQPQAVRSEQCSRPVDRSGRAYLPE